MKYSLSGGYMQQDGIVFGSDFERFSFRVNMDNDINKWLTTGLRASVARTQQTNNVDGSGAIYNALNQLPEVPARNPDGSFGMQTENMYGTYFSNPLSDLIQNENYSRNTQVYVNAFADIKLWKGLVFRTEYAANFNYSNDYQCLSQICLDGVTAVDVGNAARIGFFHFDGGSYKWLTARF